MEKINTPPDPYKLIKKFLAERDVVKLSKRQYEFNINRFVTWAMLQGKSFGELGISDVLKYKQSLLDENKTDLTVASYMTTLKLFYGWLAINDITQDLTTSIRINRTYRTFRKRSLSMDQANALLKTFDLKTPGGKRDYAITNLMLRNGLREIEVTRMNVGDIIDYNPKQKAIVIQRKGKTEKDATIPLSTKAEEAIVDYLLARPGNWQDTDPLFISYARRNKNKRLIPHHISVMIKRHLIASGINHPMVTAHSLRHTAATILLASGLNEYDVMVFMGHSNFATTQIYTRQKEKEMIFNKNIIKSLDY
jgi:integrase/recombinase XerD